MKHYIIIITSLLLSTCIIFTNTASAANYTGASYYVGDPNTRAELVETYNVQYVDSNGQASPIGDTNIAVYEFNHTINLNHTTTDGYINGSMWATFTQSVNTPTGWNFVASQITYTPIDRDTIYSFNTRTDNSEIVTSAQIRTWFYNFFPRNSVSQIGNLKIRVSFSYPASVGGSNDPDTYIGGILSISGFSRSLTVDPNPVTVGTFVDYIIAGINNSYAGQDLTEINTGIQDVLDMLEAFKNQNYQDYGNVLTALNTNNTWNSTISSYLEDISRGVYYIETNTEYISTYTHTLTQLLNNFPSYSAQVLQYLGKLSEMNAQQATEAAAIESEYADIKEQQEAANQIVKNVPRPTVSNIDIGSLTDNETRQTFNAGVSSILSFPLIERLLIIVLTFATVGFILYGRKK